MPDLVARLSEALEGVAVSDAKPHHHALLYYTLADMNEKLMQFGESAEALKAANTIQLAELARNGKTYSEKLTEEFTDKQISSFGEGFSSYKRKQTEPLVRPVFITGMPRSGTTLMESILGQYPGIQTGGELEAMEFVAAEYRYGPVSYTHLTLPTTPYV